MILMLCLVVWCSVSLVRAASEGTKCNDVDIAMTMCKEERQELSHTSKLNNVLQLCRALRHYTDCMKPQMHGCIGAAKMAFDVIISKYTGEPYKCQLDARTEKMASNDSYHISPTSIDKNSDENLKTNSQVDADKSLHKKYMMKKDTDDMSQDTQPSDSSHDSTQTTQAHLPRAGPEVRVKATAASTNKYMTVRTGTHNCATLEHPHLITAIVACIISQVWVTLF